MTAFSIAARLDARAEISKGEKRASSRGGGGGGEREQTGRRGKIERMDSVLL